MSEGEERNNGHHAVAVIEGERPTDSAENPAPEATTTRAEHFDPFSVTNVEAVRSEISGITPEQRDALRTDAEKYGWDVLSEVRINDNHLGPELVSSMRGQIDSASQELLAILKAGGISLESPEASVFAAKARQVKTAELLDGSLPVIEAPAAQEGQEASIADEQEAVKRETQRQKLTEMLALDDKQFGEVMSAWDAHQRVRFVEAYDQVRDQASGEYAERKQKDKEEIDNLNAKYDGLLETIGSGPVSWGQLEAVFNGNETTKGIDAWFEEQQAAPATAAMAEKLATLLGDRDMAGSLAGTLLVNKYVSENLMPLVAAANGSVSPAGAEQIRQQMTRLTTEPELRADMARREALIGPRPPVTPEQPKRRMGWFARIRASRARNK